MGYFKDNKILLLILVLGLTVYLPFSAYSYRASNRSVTKAYPGVSYHWFVHEIGDVWNRQGNWGMFGDDDFVYPSMDFPGGSQNAYLYQGSIWVLAIVDGDTLCTAGDELEFDPVDSVYVVTGEEAISAEDTYTRYNDLYPATPENPHTPIGIEVTEKTYAWSVDYANNFFIADYTIKNIGIDTDGDSIPDTQRTLRDVYIAIRMDCDVSSLTHGGATLWYWDDLVEYDSLNKMSYMYDGDSKEYEGDDTGNPDPTTGELISPGYIGARLLYTPDPSGQPYSHHYCHYYNDPPPNAPQYRFVAEHTYAPCPTDAQGNPYPYDYRFIQATGPFDSLAPGESLRVVWAYGVAVGLEELQKILQVAQKIFDKGFVTSLPPPSPSLLAKDYVEEEITVGIALHWTADPEEAVDPISEEKDFEGYHIWRSDKKDAEGRRIWKLLTSYDLVDGVGDDRWPPDSSTEPGYQYMFIDTIDVVRGFNYAYSITSFDKGDTLAGIESLESSKLENLITYIPTNPSATTAAALDNIRVIPNPYLGSAPWNNPRPHYGEPWVDRIQFVNLPADAIVRIYTLDGDLVREIRSGDLALPRTPEMMSECKSVAEWDLLSRNKQKVTSGIYIYVVESSLGTKRGKFIIIR